jgi:hypothetical protein
VVALDEEMSGAMDIDILTCQRSSPGNPAEGTFYDFQIYMGLCETDMLSSAFEDNYILGTRILVFSRDTLTLSPSAGEWQDFDLDAPYWYNGQDNLLVEFLWSGGDTEDDCLYSWHWDTGTIRSISGVYGAPSGTMSSLIVMLKFTGDLSLTQMTHGSIKALFSPGEGDL